MPTQRNHVGSRWGAVTLLNIVARPVVITKLDGSTYKPGSTHPIEWELECQCGHRWTILERTFPGRRYLRNCGRDECSVRLDAIGMERAEPGIRGRKPSPERGIAVPVYMPMPLYLRLRAMADSEGMSLSKMFVMTCNLGVLEYMPTKKPIDLQKAYPDIGDAIQDAEAEDDEE